MSHTASRVPRWPYRRLRCFAFDPILSRQIDTYEINEVISKIPWDGKMTMGPIDSYLEVIDFDPGSQVFYAPVDLNDQNLLAQDGLTPSEGNPQFHRQMAYAVARTTIEHFEHALGRCALWSPSDKEKPGKGFVEHLRIQHDTRKDWATDTDGMLGCLESLIMPLELTGSLGEGGGCRG